ncbi:MAG: hypothetical protein H7645_10325 [Candidatus Heimdallarchaeota archaeon]|nr:hypothetical protein [Candidatus Heimdallarchaeota archaeon]MCK4770724.1 hypothetical protein [Candidatus Heimdallarchaeota archaeon]
MLESTVLQGRDVNDLYWNAILIFGGGLTLGVILTESGGKILLSINLEILVESNSEDIQFILVCLA